MSAQPAKEQHSVAGADEVAGRRSLHTPGGLFCEKGI